MKPLSEALQIFIIAACMMIMLYTWGVRDGWAYEQQQTPNMDAPCWDAGPNGCPMRPAAMSDRAQFDAMAQAFVESINATTPRQIDPVTTALGASFSPEAGIMTLRYEVDLTYPGLKLDWEQGERGLRARYCSDGPAGWLSAQGYGQAISYVDQDGNGVREFVFQPEDCKEIDDEKGTLGDGGV